MNLKHLGIIADGNRRWARERGLPKVEGHRKGFANFENLIQAAAGLGIPYVSFYVFSMENWGREKSEVDYLMNIIRTKTMKLAEKMAKNNVKMVTIGSKHGLDPELVSILEKAEKMTAECTGTTVGFCFNYGGKEEICDAANKTLAAGEEITPENIRKHLYHPEVPDVDMIVRTSGEERISGFMLWRGAYAEMLFIKKYFPEMNEDDLRYVVQEFEKRNRRFGK